MANQYAENAVIGSILVDSECVLDLIPVLHPLDFQTDLNRAIWVTVCEMAVRGEEIDPVLIHGKMVESGRDTPNLDRYFMELMEITPTAANVMEYAKLLRQARIRDSIVNVIEDAADEARLTGDFKTVERSMIAALDVLHSTTESPVADSASAIASFRSWLDAVRADPEHAVVRSGFRALDAQLGGGFFKSGLYVVGARPGMGKTTLAVNLAEYIGTRRRVLFVSLEMDKVQVTAKRIAVQSGVNYTALMTGRLTDADLDVLPIALQKVESRTVDVIDEGISTVADLSAFVATRSNYDIIFVDYLGILSPAPEDAQKPRYEQITNISRDLKALAKRSHIPVVALAQLNRESASTKKRPTLTDLRDSGAIEQDADGVILLYRQSYAEEEKPEQEDIELILAKNRHGSCGTVVFNWDAPTGRICEIERRSDYDG